ncbi:hddc2 [Scenedesmus sp. PABB004]|nr:hddc2 [Scenedesmus sp. PABB004]
MASSAAAAAPGGAPCASGAAGAGGQPSPAAALDFIMLLQNLKTTPRTGWVRCGVAGPESIADHMYRMGMMALLCSGGGAGGVDGGRALRMALVHDVAEAVVGDITPHCGVSEADKHAAEAAAISRIKDMLGPHTHAAQEVEALWHEYEAQATPEAHLVKDFDKLEMIVQAHEYEQAQGMSLQQFFDSTAGKFRTPTGCARRPARPARPEAGGGGGGGAGAAPPLADARGARPQARLGGGAAAGDGEAAPGLQALRRRAAQLEALEAYEALLASHPAPPAGAAPEAQRALDVPVLDAALLIARHEDPWLDASAVRAQLDAFAAAAAARLPPDARRYPLRVLRAINDVLYDEQGFSGNNEDYYNPANRCRPRAEGRAGRPPQPPAHARHVRAPTAAAAPAAACRSCINRVLETKKGIPISLSLLYAEVAARLGVTMEGVNLPAHFMLRVADPPGVEMLVDPFNRGELTALQDAEGVLSRLMGHPVKLDPRFVSGDVPRFSSRALLLRLLNNLRTTYMTLNLHHNALLIVRYMRGTVPPGALPELLRDEGLCLYGLGRLAEAGAALGEYLGAAARAGGAPGDAAAVEAILERIQHRAAEAAAAAAAAAAEAAAARGGGGGASGGGGSGSDSGSSSGSSGDGDAAAGAGA